MNTPVLPGARNTAVLKAFSDDDQKARNQPDRFITTVDGQVVYSWERGSLPERAENLSDDTISKVASMFEPWAPGLNVSTGDLLQWQGEIVEVVQAHTTQSDWTPDLTPALFMLHRDPAGPPQPWVQPLGSHDAYQVGERVTHNDSIWENTVDNNVWEPGIFGWVLVEGGN